MSTGEIPIQKQETSEFDMKRSISGTGGRYLEDLQDLLSPKRWHSECEQVSTRRKFVKYTTRTAKQPPISKRLRALNRQISPKRCRVHCDLRANINCSYSQMQHGFKELPNTYQLGRLIADCANKISSDLNNNSSAGDHDASKKMSRKDLSSKSLHIGHSSPEFWYDRRPNEVRPKDVVRRHSSPSLDSENQSRQSSPKCKAKPRVQKIDREETKDNVQLECRSTKITRKLRTEPTPPEPPVTLRSEPSPHEPPVISNPPPEISQEQLDCSVEDDNESPSVAQNLTCASSNYSVLSEKTKASIIDDIKAHSCKDYSRLSSDFIDTVLTAIEETSPIITISKPTPELSPRKTKKTEEEIIPSPASEGSPKNNKTKKKRSVSRGDSEKSESVKSTKVSKKRPRTPTQSDTRTSSLDKSKPKRNKPTILKLKRANSMDDNLKDIINKSEKISISKGKRVIKNSPSPFVKLKRAKSMEERPVGKTSKIEKTNGAKSKEDKDKEQKKSTKQNRSKRVLIKKRDVTHAQVGKKVDPKLIKSEGNSSVDNSESIKLYEKPEIELDPKIVHSSNSAYNDHRNRFKVAVERLRKTEKQSPKEPVNCGEPGCGDQVREMTKEASGDLANNTLSMEEAEDGNNAKIAEHDLSEKDIEVFHDLEDILNVTTASELAELTRLEREPTTTYYEVFGLCFLIATTTACLYYSWDSKREKFQNSLISEGSI